MTAAGKVAFLAKENLLGTLRDRTAMFFIFFLPFVIILMVGVFIGGYSRLPLGVVVPAHGRLAADLERELAGQHGLHVERFSSVPALERAVRRQTVMAGLVIPSTYDKSVREGGPVHLQLVADRTRLYPLGIRAVVSGAVDRQGATLQAANFAAGAAHADFDVALATAHDVGVVHAVRARVQSLSGSGSDIQLGFGYTAPANLVLFVFVNSLGAANGLIIARALGCTRRMLATPTSASTIMLGDAIGRFAIALFQGALIVAVGAWLFNVTWGDPVAVMAVVVVFALVSAASAQLLGTYLTSVEQNNAVAPVVGIVLGMLGGCMWPLAIVSSALRTLGHLTPHAWAMDAALALSGGKAGLGAVRTELMVLGGFAVVLFLLSTARLRRVLA